MVPAFQDVEHSRRELAETGATFGAQVVRFSHLSRMIARRAGLPAPGWRPSSSSSSWPRTRCAGRASRCWPTRPARPGFARAALRFFAELERSMVEPPRLIQALRTWAGDGPRAPYAEEIGELYRRYRDGLEAAGLVDDELFAWGALSALRAQPSAWAGTPVFVYGFDDFTELEFRTIEELAVYAEADVVVSLPFEPGREAFKATATLRERLREVAAEEMRARRGQRPLRQGLARRAARAGAHGCSSRAPPTADPGEAVDPARRRRRARRAGAVRRRGGGAAARRHAARRRGRGLPRPAALRVAGRAGVRRLRDPVLDGPHRALRPHRRGPRPAGAAALRAAGGQRRRPAGLPAHARPAARARAGRPAGGRRAPPRRAHRRRRPRAVGGAPGPVAARRRSTSCARPPTPPRCCSGWPTGWSACSAPPTSAPRRGCRAPSWTTRARSAPATPR